MAEKPNFGNYYLNASRQSEDIEREIDIFLKERGSQYPVEKKEINEDAPPKGSALFYLGKQNSDPRERRIQELRVERDVIGHLD